MLLVALVRSIAVGCDLAQAGNHLLLPEVVSDELCGFIDRGGRHDSYGRGLLAPHL
jgi:hypothetical protein